MGKKKNDHEFNTENIINEIWADLINGVSRYEAKQKLDNDLYTIPTSHWTKAGKYRVIREAYAIAKSNLDEERDKQRELFYNRLLDQYADAVQAHDRMNALKALDMFAKFGGLYEDKHKVEVSGRVEQDITIDFHFDD